MSSRMTQYLYDICRLNLALKGWPIFLQHNVQLWLEILSIKSRLIWLVRVTKQKSNYEKYECYIAQRTLFKSLVEESLSTTRDFTCVFFTHYAATCTIKDNCDIGHFLCFFARNFIILHTRKHGTRNMFSTAMVTAWRMKINHECWKKLARVCFISRSCRLLRRESMGKEEGRMPRMTIVVCKGSLPAGNIEIDGIHCWSNSPSPKFVFRVIGADVHPHSASE